MLNREVAKSVFNDYVKQFDMNNVIIARKVTHCYRVADLCVSIADSFFMSKEEVELLYIIGLYHDIGHFEIIQRYGKKNDAIDHADHALKVLFDEKLIRKFDKSQAYDSIIQTTVFAHNKVVIPDNYDDTSKKYAQILRDADKLDIFFELEAKEIEIPLRSHDVTPIVWETFKNNQPIQKELLETDADHLLKVIAYVYDINFKYSLFIIEEHQYIVKILDSYRSNDQRINILLDLIMEIIQKYMKKRMDTYVG